VHPVLDLLNQVTCDSLSLVRAAPVAWADDDSSGKKIIARLGVLHKQGCDVRISLGYYPGEENAEGTPSPAFFDNLDKLGLRWAKVHQHTKYLIVRSRFGSSGPWRDVVLTGSYNYDRGSLSTGPLDASIRVEHDFHLFNTYLDNWHKVCNAGFEWSSLFTCHRAQT
jgi:hypothetical protein